MWKGGGEARGHGEESAGVDFQWNDGWWEGYGIMTPLRQGAVSESRPFQWSLSTRYTGVEGTNHFGQALAARFPMEYLPATLSSPVAQGGKAASS